MGAAQFVSRLFMLSTVGRRHQRVGGHGKIHGTGQGAIENTVRANGVRGENLGAGLLWAFSSERYHVFATPSVLHLTESWRSDYPRP